MPRGNYGYKVSQIQAGRPAASLDWVVSDREENVLNALKIIL